MDALENLFTEPNSVLAELTDTYMQWPIALSTLGKIASRKGAYHVQVADYIKTVRRILKEVDDDLSANRRFTALYERTLAAENDYRRKYALQQGLLKTGLISYKALLESKINLDTLALSTNLAKLQLAMSLVMLYQDLAGGYQSEALTG